MYKRQGLIHPETLLSDTPRAFKGYEPENADGGFRGPISARMALLGSRNRPGAGNDSYHHLVALLGGCDGIAFGRAQFAPYAEQMCIRDSFRAFSL